MRRSSPRPVRPRTGKARDPEMHQTKKGNQWHFGMKAHIGADAPSGLVHTVMGTAANVSDISQTHALLHGQRDRACRRGLPRRGEAPGNHRRHGGVAWHVAIRRGKLKAIARELGQRPDVGHEQLARARAWSSTRSTSSRTCSATRSALPRAGEEHRATAHPVRAGQPGDRQASACSPRAVSDHAWTVP